MSSMNITEVLFETTEDTTPVAFYSEKVAAHIEGTMAIKTITTLPFRTDDNGITIALAAELFTADTGTLVLRGEQDEVRVIIYVAEEE